MGEYCIFLNLAKDGLTIGTLHMIGQDLGIKKVQGENYEDTVFNAISAQNKIEEICEFLNFDQMARIYLEE